MVARRSAPTPGSAGWRRWGRTRSRATAWCFEKAGVNWSNVDGELAAGARRSDAGRNVRALWVVGTTSAMCRKHHATFRVRRSRMRRRASGAAHRRRWTSSHRPSRTPRRARERVRPHRATRALPGVGAERLAHHRRQASARADIDLELAEELRRAIEKVRHVCMATIASSFSMLGTLWRRRLNRQHVGRSEASESWWAAIRLIRATRVFASSSSVTCGGCRGRACGRLATTARRCGRDGIVRNARRMYKGFVRLRASTSSSADPVDHGTFLPREIVEELETLQDDVPSQSYRKIRKTFVASFGKPPDQVVHDVFPRADRGRVAGQVHEARNEAATSSR